MKFAANLNLKEHQFFLLTLSRSLTMHIQFILLMTLLILLNDSPGLHQYGPGLL